MPTSIIKDNNFKSGLYYPNGYNGIDFKGRNGKSRYDPPLPTSVIENKDNDIGYGVSKNNTIYGDLEIPQLPNNYRANRYDPPLPTSVIENKDIDMGFGVSRINSIYGELDRPKQPNNYRGKVYDPPLPTSLLRIKSTRGKHKTEKPVALMSWILKYYSKEGDIVLDPTMGSGSTGVACREMKRKFIGIEMNDEFFKTAKDRLN